MKEYPFLRNIRLRREGFFMEQNQMLFYMMAASCMICIMIGIVRKPAYLLILFSRGIFCAVIVYAISIFCFRKGISSPVNLNIVSIGTGALLGLPGIIVLYAAAVFLLQ